MTITKSGKLEPYICLCYFLNILFCTVGNKYSVCVGDYKVGMLSPTICSLREGQCKQEALINRINKQKENGIKDRF